MECTHSNSQLPPPSGITENIDPQHLWSDFYNKHYANTSTNHPPQQTATPPPNPPAPKLSFVDSIIQDHNAANKPPQTWIQPKNPIQHNLVTNMPPQPQNALHNPFSILGVEPITNADEMEVEVVEQPTTLQPAPQRQIRQCQCTTGKPAQSHNINQVYHNHLNPAHSSSPTNLPSNSDYLIPTTHPSMSHSQKPDPSHTLNPNPNPNSNPSPSPNANPYTNPAHSSAPANLPSNLDYLIPTTNPSMSHLQQPDPNHTPNNNPNPNSNPNPNPSPNANPNPNPTPNSNPNSIPTSNCPAPNPLTQDTDCLIIPDTDPNTTSQQSVLILSTDPVQNEILDLISPPPFPNTPQPLPSNINQPPSPASLLLISPIPPSPILPSPTSSPSILDCNITLSQASTQPPPTTPSPPNIPPQSTTNSLPTTTPTPHIPKRKNRADPLSPLSPP